jgi:hypothetical protein
VLGQPFVVVAVVHIDYPHTFVFRQLILLVALVLVLVERQQRYLDPSFVVVEHIVDHIVVVGQLKLLLVVLERQSWLVLGQPFVVVVVHIDYHHTFVFRQLKLLVERQTWLVLGQPFVVVAVVHIDYHHTFVFRQLRLLVALVLVLVERQQRYLDQSFVVHHIVVDHIGYMLVLVLELELGLGLVLVLGYMMGQYTD